MFSLIKTEDTWTLHYEVSPLRRIVGIGAGLAGIGVGIFETTRTTTPLLYIALPILPALAFMGCMLMYSAATTTIFDLAQRRVTVRCARPWFGPPRSFTFAEITSLYASKEARDPTDCWEARIEFPDGSKIRLGEETVGRYEHIRGYLEEIRNTTGIAGSRGCSEQCG